MTEVVDPFRALLDLDTQYKREGVIQTDQLQTNQWSGIAFELNGVRYVAPLGEVTEIMHLPPLTKVPGSRSWLRGVANVRGSLLPVADLPMFFGFNQGTIGRRQRVLVVAQDQSQVGIIVDDVFGLQHFELEDRLEVGIDVDETLRPYVLGAFSRNEQVWPVFSPAVLTRHSGFKQVSL